ncbi:GNAT family N-acetyltransferase [Dermacoccaceae bacterium W4C1]
MIRPATEADASALERLGTEAFGHPPRQSPAPVNAPGRHTLLADAGTEADADPVGCVVTLDFESWFWGRRVPTAGVASVKIATEHRGEGLLRPLLTRALQERHAEGAVLSTLFPTAPGIYRSLGYEVFAEYAERTVLPTADLTRVRPGGASVRRASVADVPNLRDVYADWARAHNGPLTRDGARFPFTDEELLAAFTGVSIAEQDGRCTGYALWNRTGGYQHEGILEVADLVCLTPEAARSLLRTLGTH